MLLVGGGWKALLVLASAAAGFVAGLLVFIQGFLLTRHALTDASACTHFGETHGDGCWMPKKFNRTVLLLIDGLRYDFAAYDESANSEVVPPYLNKMPIFKEILQESGIKRNRGHTFPWKGSGFLAKFIADAPTTTMQRLKGLITGGLPTFIDLAQNFDSTSISEDNLVQQLELQGRNITVLGDDTWRGLFPHRFARSFLFPSFNVRDLDTVDNGILEHLDDELANPHCDVLIAHFLGVDHAGHRYGPNHPSMTRKLQQMNDVVRRVSESIDEDTLLLVFGDHGMTSTGDHGGDSANEVTSAFFVYSPGLVRSSTAFARALKVATEITGSVSDNVDPNLGASQSATPLEGASWEPPALVQQVSLVPTVALLLGVPIPYSNVGSVLPQLFGPLADQMTALSLNVRQVHRYLTHYNREFSSNRFPLRMWENLVRLEQEITELESLSLKNSDYLHHHPNSLEKNESFENQEHLERQLLKRRKVLYEEYLTLAKVMCEEVWATFDVSVMAGGIVLMAVALVNLFVIAFAITKKEEVLTFFLKGNCILCAVLFLTLALRTLYPIPVLNFIPAFLGGVIVVFHIGKMTSLSLYAAYKDILPLGLFFLVCCGSFSNSFVVHEDAVIAFAVISLFAYQASRILLVHKTKTFEKGKINNMSAISLRLAIIVVGAFLSSSIALRWSLVFRRCREEQHDCESTTSYLPLSSIDNALQNKRFFSGVILLTMLVCLPRQWLSYCGNLNGTRAAVFIYRNNSVISGVMVVAYWALEAVPKPSTLILSYTNYPPRVVYILTLLTIFVAFIKPLYIYQLQKSKRQYYHQTHSNALIAELFNDLKIEFSKPKEQDPESDTPVVYGLATSLSASLVVMGAMTVMVILLLLGDGMALPLLLLLFTVGGFCFLHAASCWQNPLLDSVMRLRWAAAVTWCVLSLHGFYCLGHQTTFPTLPWSAAFVGHVQDGAGGVIVPGLLVLLHTFCSHLVLGLLLPLLPLAPLAIGVMLPSLRRKRSGDDLQRGEFVLVDRPEVYVASATAFSVSYVALHAAKVLFTCVSCLFLRRHLMMWKIFAPHLIFESIGLLVTVCSVCAGLCLAYRTLAALEIWAIRISFLNKKPL